MAQSVTKNNQLVENRGESGKIELKGYSTGLIITGATASSTSGYVTVSPSPSPPPVSKKQFGLAILAHIQAIRALGRTEINTQEIADALCISVQKVNDVLEVLKKQGVRRR
jgi:CHASE2 domain-containing sensor protein